MRGARLRPRALYPLAVVAPVVVLGALGAFVGCGGSNQDSDEAEAIEMRIDRERADAAALAQQRQSVRRLQKEVKKLKQGRSSGGATPAPAATKPVEVADSGSVRTFHAPSGNVSCEISESSARCSVAAASQTFVFDPGAEARIESGLALSRGSGSLADWGSTVALGSVRCSIPEENEPRGITCEDTSSGHGFEASRVTSRQRVY